MITDAQAETIQELRRRKVEPGQTIEIYDIFSKRNNLDNAHRRNCGNLAKAGLMQFSRGTSEMVVKQALFDAYNEWYQKHGFKKR